MMNPVKDYFEQNKYVILGQVIPKERADTLVKHMFSLHEQGKLINDGQCPVSDAVYADPHMEQLMHDLAKPIGNHIGRDLLPTYAYARIYRPGEILKKHKDREACEISATLTLGFDAKQIWPIYMDEQKEVGINLDVGDMVVYKGCEILHWRRPFKGNWHVQVFLHYVDANGPYKNESGDPRARSSKQILPNADERQAKGTDRNEVKIRPPYFNSMVLPSNDETFPGYLTFNSKFCPELSFTPQECQRIIDLTKDIYGGSAGVGADTNARVAREIRNAEIFILENDEENRWLYQKLAAVISVANNKHFDYDLAGIVHGLQLIRYTYEGGESLGHYQQHVDAGPGASATRKLSLVVQLSNPEDYTDCDLIVNDLGRVVHASRERGSVHMFPSYAPHEVTKITRGTRYSLVIWVHGTRRFR